MLLMIMDVEFLQKLLDKLSDSICSIHITDEDGRVLVSSLTNRVGTQSKTALYVIQIGRPSLIDPQTSAGDERTYCTPVFTDDLLQGCVVVKGPSSSVVMVGNMVRYSIETALEYEIHTQAEQIGDDKQNMLAKLLLQPNVDQEKALSLMNHLELDPTLLRCVICVDLVFHQTKYFSINLNLGYQSAIEQIREDIVKKIRSNQFLNSQDMVLLYSKESVVIIKSFVPVKDLSRIYLSLDVICQSIGTMLDANTALSYHMAYGNLQYGISSIYKSLSEAKDTLTIGCNSRNKEPLYNLESILFEHISYHLQPQISNKLIEPALKKLQAYDEQGFLDILSCAETYVDTNLNITATAERLKVHRNTVTTRLEKLKNLTNLDPIARFQDAFLVKLLAIYRRSVEVHIET